MATTFVRKVKAPVPLITLSTTPIKYLERYWIIIGSIEYLKFCSNNDIFFFVWNREKKIDQLKIGGKKY